jgi:hypothetical protein
MEKYIGRKFKNEHGIWVVKSESKWGCVIQGDSGQKEIDKYELNKFYKEVSQ